MQIFQEKDMKMCGETFTFSEFVSTLKMLMCEKIHEGKFSFNENIIIFGSSLEKRKRSHTGKSR
jgi:hypothetical protein